MARPMGPRFKLVRHLGVDVFGHSKALDKGINRHKYSEHGEQLLEKQKLKAYYGVLEKQFKRYVKKSLSAIGNPREVLIQNLETRLDNMTYRLGFGSTLRQSRQMIVHGHILVNGRKVDCPSYSVQMTDIISLKDSSKKNNTFVNNFKNSDNFLSYTEKNIDDFSGNLLRLPFREEVPIDVRDAKVLEFYSKN